MQQQTLGRIIFLLSFAFFMVAANYLAEWYYYEQMGFHNRFRFENGAHVKGEVLELYEEYVTRQKGYKIAVIGDSVVQGANVPAREQTITAHLQEELRGSWLPGARVFNFGFPGGRPADLYMELQRLHQAGAVQLFIINVSYPFFSEEIAKTPLLYFKVWRPILTPAQLIEFKVPPEKPGERSITAAVYGSSKEAGTEQQLQEKVKQYWAVYRYRQELNRFLFDGQPAVKGKEYFDQLVYRIMPAPKETKTEESTEEPVLSEKDKPENKYRVWHDFPWNDADKKHLKKVFNVTGTDNVNFKYYRELCRYIEENKIPAVIFLSPVNHALLQQYQLLDYESYRKNSALIEKEARQRNILFFNYQEEISPDLFHDSLHMLDGGNAATARLLSRDLQLFLEGETIR